MIPFNHKTTLVFLLRFISILLLSSLSTAPGTEFSPQNFDDPDLHLFVDDFEIQQSTNLARVLNRPRKHPEPVLVSDKPWEGDRVQAWGSVVQEPDGRLRMWYFALNTERNPKELDRGGYAYAESRDGIHWRKPNLGIVEFKGRKRNNLFYTFAPDGHNLIDEELARRGMGLPALDEHGNQIGILNNADGISVIRDDMDPDPQKRYKLIANMQDHRMWAPSYKDHYPDVTPEQVKQAWAVFGQYVDTSPDGFHWTRRPRRMLSTDHSDYMMALYDHRNQQWWLNERARGVGGRNAALRTSKNLVHWSDAKIIFDNGPENDFGRRWQWHGGLTPFNYGNLNLGFSEKWSSTAFGNVCELVSNRDGQPWRRIAPGQAYLDTGGEGDFDRILAYPTHNAPVRIGDKLFIYYTGGGVRTHPKRGMPMAIGLATLNLDRFAGLAHYRGDPGMLVTKSFEVRGSRLEINVDPLDDAQVSVAVSGDNGEIIPGYTHDDSQIQLFTGQSYAPVKWKTKADLSELRKRNISLHFRIKGAVIYSYRFAQ